MKAKAKAKTNKALKQTEAVIDIIHRRIDGYAPGSSVIARRALQAKWLMESQAPGEWHEHYQPVTSALEGVHRYVVLAVIKIGELDYAKQQGRAMDTYAEAENAVYRHRNAAAADDSSLGAEHFVAILIK